MKNLFECLVRCERIDDNGKSKKVIERYVVSAFVSHDVEIILLKVLEACRDIEIVSIKQIKLHDIIKDHGEDYDNWYRARVALMTLNERNGTTKRTLVSVLVNGVSLEGALAYLTEWQDTSMIDMELLSLSLTQVRGVL